MSKTPMLACSISYGKLDDTIKSQVNHMLEDIQQKGIVRATKEEVEFLLKLGVIQPEFIDLFQGVLEDPRSEKQINYDIEKAIEEIF